MRRRRMISKDITLDIELRKDQDTDKTSQINPFGNPAFSEDEYYPLQITIVSKWHEDGSPRDHYEDLINANNRLAKSLEEQRKKNEELTEKIYIPDNIEHPYRDDNYHTRRKEESNSREYEFASRAEDITSIIKWIDIETALEKEAELIKNGSLDSQIKSIPELLLPQQDLKIYRADLEKAYEEAKWDYFQLKELAS